jgi:hypothetical protein
MFKVQDPEKPHIPATITRTLKQALRVKMQWNEWMGFHAVITDEDGYVVSSREQERYLLDN